MGTYHIKLEITRSMTEDFEILVEANSSEEAENKAVETAAHFPNDIKTKGVSRVLVTEQKSDPVFENLVIIKNRKVS